MHIESVGSTFHHKKMDLYSWKTWQKYPNFLLIFQTTFSENRIPVLPETSEQEVSHLNVCVLIPSYLFSPEDNPDHEKHKTSAPKAFLIPHLDDAPEEEGNQMEQPKGFCCFYSVKGDSTDIPNFQAQFFRKNHRDLNWREIPNKNALSIFLK